MQQFNKLRGIKRDGGQCWWVRNNSRIPFYYWPLFLTIIFVPCTFQAGSVHVRIRRDANEQMVLAHVTNRLSTLISTLTVQIFKDEWARPVLSSGAMPRNMLTIPDHHIIQMPSLKTSGDELSPMTSTPSKPSSPPPEFAFNTPGKNINPVILSNTQTKPYGPGLYGSSPYGSTFSQGFGVPGLGSTQGLRTGYTNVANRYGTYTPQQSSQFNQWLLLCLKVSRLYLAAPLVLNWYFFFTKQCCKESLWTYQSLKLTCICIRLIHSLWYFLHCEYWLLHIWAT